MRGSLPLLTQALKQSSQDFASQYGPWRDEVLAMKEAHPFGTRHLDTAVSPEDIFAAVQERTPDDTIIVTDVGQHQMWAAQFCQLTQPRCFVSSGGLGTMGYGLPAALGAKVGCPKRTVVLFTGDGSIMMNCQEFATLHKYGIAVKVVVLHNNVLGMVNQWQRMFYNGHYSQSVIRDNPDLPTLTKAMGVPGFTARKPEELAAAMDELFAVDGPALLDVFIPEDEDVYPMVPGGKRLEEMVLGGNA